jgi:hypothetical protein
MVDFQNFPGLFRWDQFNHARSVFMWGLCVELNYRIIDMFLSRGFLRWDFWACAFLRWYLARSLVPTSSRFNILQFLRFMNVASMRGK